MKILKVDNNVYALIKACNKSRFEIFVKEAISHFVGNMFLEENISIILGTQTLSKNDHLKNNSFPIIFLETIISIIPNTADLKNIFLHALAKLTYRPPCSSLMGIFS